MEDTSLSPETEEELAMDYNEALGIGYPRAREKNTIVEFLNKAFKTKDSTKVSFMNDEEILSLRVLQNAALFADVWELDIVSAFLKDRAEIIAAPTMGRGGNLINAAITTKKEFQARLKEPPKKKKLFGKEK